MSTSVESPDQIKLKQNLQAAVEKGNLIPGQPSEEQVETHLFKMMIKKGPTTSTLFFKLDGKKSEVQRMAEDKGRSYCQKFRVRFIWVEFFLIDIEAEPRSERDNEN